MVGITHVTLLSFPTTLRNSLYVNFNFVVFLRVEVGKRCGSTKIEARGLFKGAKVTRSPDLEGISSDRDPNVVGVVEEVVSSNDEDTRDSVRVSWKKGGQTFIYRVGKDGKVCTT